ncbi:methyl-accepting chemotaxis protein [Clostridium felsineum]|uniref:methyl-accepting chemotaxis protein n=1 Tax=Clostridium felsineum TaxID=36839 RepID=UPI00098C5DCC|nr:methyl-accepting chemotaxis protein [Clostridium felsineum]URZ03840.1 Methyl-accepting chemotaxis protein McpB [Clostridium felsineum]
MKIKSIRARTLVSVLPVIVVILMIIISVSYYFSRNMLNKEIDLKMTNNINQLKETITNKLEGHQRVAETLARTIEADNFTITNKDYKSLLSKYSEINADTFGVGIWYEPWKFKSDMKYFGPYVYKDGDKLVYTEDYMTADYDYPSQPWYKDSKNSKVNWTPPYYDPATQITMATAAVPFYDKNNNFIGETSADINLNKLQHMVDSLKIGSTGKAFLLTKEGFYITGSKDKIMKQSIKKDSKFSEVSGEILSGKSGSSNYTDGSDKRLVYYTSIGQTNWILAITISQSEIYKSLNSLLNIMILLSLGMLILVSATIIVYGNYITKNIAKVNNFSKTISEGDLTNTMKVASEDELGDMTKNLNTMAENLKNVFRNFRVNLDNIVGTSEELKQSAEKTEMASAKVSNSMAEISEKVDLQASSTRSMSMEVEGINKAIKNIKENISKTFELSDFASRAAGNGDKLIGEAVKQIDKMAKNVNESVDKVNMLEDKSNKINSIIEIINSISEQTDLLALNAAIEAASAGEAGRGFAVVADEVRKLAGESSKAAEEIGILIRDIQLEINNTIESMKIGAEAVDKGSNLVKTAGNSFEEIVKSVKQVSDKINDVVNEVDGIYNSSNNMTNNVSNIAGAADLTSENVKGIAEASEEQSALMEQIVRASEALTKIVVELQGEIKRYKI